MTDITCPKCLSRMRSIDRSGITIERCESCGGIYLDRSELDQLIRLENEFVEQRYQPAQERRRDRRDDRDRNQDRNRDDDDDWWDDDDRSIGGFLGDLLKNIR